MSSRLRAAIALLGVLIIVVSLFALAYAFGPGENLVEKVILAPTLFSPP
jgi:hypothetical protein